MSLGKRLTGLRKDQNMSREDLAKRLGLSYWAIAKYETDERVPSPDMLSKMSEIFCVSVDYLLGLVNDPNPTQDFASRDNSVTREPLPDWINSLPPKLIEFIKNEAEEGSPYLNILYEARLKEISPEGLRQVIQAWADSIEALRKRDQN